MKKQHEKVNRELSPDKGGIYNVSMNGQELYKAEVIDYKKGACWATLMVLNPGEGFNDMYKTGDTFQIKVAHYEFK